MKIIIAGAGKVGFSVARELAGEGHDITVIDRSPGAVTRASNVLDVICYEGSATNSALLRDAGAEHADLLLAATESDEVNMVCGISARKLGTKNVIARIRDPEYLSQTEFLRDALGLSVTVNPEYECAMEIARILRFPSAVRVDTFAGGKMDMIEYRIPRGSRLDGMQLKLLPGFSGAKLLVAVVERGSSAVIPNGDFTLRSDDRLSITGSAEELRRFFESVDAYKKPVRSVIIMGGGRTAVYLTRMLSESGIKVTIIDRDAERCNTLCDLVPMANIIHGDATRDEVLLEEGLRSSDAFVALTGEDGDNVVTSMYARKNGVNTIVAKVNREHFSRILETAGLDSIVNAHNIVSQQLTRYVRAMNASIGGSMETLYKLADGKIEALEFTVSESSSCTGIKLRDLRLKPNILICAVIRGSSVIIPNGDTEILPGDHAIIAAAAGSVKNIDNITESDK